MLSKINVNESDLFQVLHDPEPDLGSAGPERRQGVLDPEGEGVLRKEQADGPRPLRLEGRSDREKKEGEQTCS